MPNRASRASPSRSTARPSTSARTTTPIPPRYITKYPTVVAVTPSRSERRSGTVWMVP